MKYIEAPPIQEWIDRLQRSLPSLEEMIQEDTGFKNLKIAADCLERNLLRKFDDSGLGYFHLTVDKQWNHTELGVLGLSIKSAQMYLYCNHFVRDRFTWFPLKLSWSMKSLGSNGGAVFPKGAVERDDKTRELSYWFDNLEGVWRTSEEHWKYCQENREKLYEPEKVTLLG